VIDLKEAERALAETQASVVKAAERLGVKASDLRRLIARNPELIAVTLEAAERDMDKAEQIILDGMDSSDKLKRLEAAARVLKGRFRARQ
jgi:hypothetical protein